MKTPFALLLLGLGLIALLAFTGDRAIRQSDSSYRSAVASREQARAAQEWSRAQTAQAKAEAEAAQAPARAALLTAVLATAALIGLAAAAGLSAALVRGALHRARFVPPDRHTGLYPALPDGRSYQVINETGAQVLAAAAARAPLRAPTAGRILTTLLSPPPIPSAHPERSYSSANPPLVSIVEPDEVLLPDRASIYDVPRSPRAALPIGMGANGPVMLPLKNLGNILIAGLPGSGKSNILASIVWAMGAWASARFVQVAMIDTKRIDFGRLPADLRVMWRPVAVDIPDGRALIADALAECNRRFAAIDSGAETPPYLVVIIDELADWTGDKAFTEAALEIGRKGRAAGVSLILATQMARADAIEPRLRAIAGACIAMRLRSAADSRMVIGQPGAELLPVDKPGRCLISRGDIVPAQAYYAGLDSDDPACEFYRRLEALPHRGPGDPTVTTATTAQPPVATTAQPPVFAPDSHQPPPRLDHGRQPSPDVAAWMRAAYHRGESKTVICQTVWGYKDGIVFSYVNDAIAGRI